MVADKFSSYTQAVCFFCFFFQVVSGNLLPEAVTWFFTSVLRGLQVHGEHQVCHTTLSQLAMLIYENLVRLTAIITLITALCVCVWPHNFW